MCILIPVGNIISLHSQQEVHACMLISMYISIPISTTHSYNPQYNLQQKQQVGAMRHIHMHNIVILTKD